MNRTTTKLPVEFGQDVRYEVLAQFQPLISRGSIRDLEQLKEKLLRQQMHESRDVRLYNPLRRAAAEAASLAWSTPYPLLVLPGLMEEKRLEAQARVEHQRTVLARSQAIYAVAA